MIENSKASLLANLISELVPEGHTWVLNIMREEDGSFATISSTPPRLAGELMQRMAAAWSPEEVDNIR